MRRRVICGECVGVVQQRGFAEAGEQRLRVLKRGGFIEGNRHSGFIDWTEIDPACGSGSEDAFGRDVADGESVEDGLGIDDYAGGLEAMRQHLGEQADALRDFLQAGRAVVNGIHRGDDGEQDLGGTDVRRGFVTADMLLACAEGETHGRVAMNILGDADEATGHLALKLVLGGEEARVRAAESHRYTETLSGTDGDIGAEFTRRTQERKCEQIGRNDAKCAGGMGLFKEVREIVDAARGIGILDEDAESFVREVEPAMIADDDVDVQGFGPRPDDIDGLRVAFFGNEKLGGVVAVAEFYPVGEHHGLGRRSAFVEHGSVGDLHPRKVGDKRLEIQECFEAALGNFGLVRRVGGVPTGIFENIALDDPGSERVVVSGADEAPEDLIPRGNGAEFGKGGRFASGLWGL